MRITVSSLLLLIFLFSCESKGDLLEQKSKTQSSTSQFTDPTENQFALDVQHYVNSVNNEDWQEVILTTFPPVYGSKDNKEVIQDFVQAKTFGIQRSIQLNKIEKITKIIEDEENRYAKIYLNAIITFKLTGQAEEKKDILKTNIELSYDTPEVHFNPMRNTLTVEAYYPFIAISKKGSNIWKYIEVDKQKEPSYGNIISQKILDQLD